MPDAQHEKMIKDAFARHAMRNKLAPRFTDIEFGPWKTLENASPGYYNADFTARRENGDGWIVGNIGYDPAKGGCPYMYYETDEPPARAARTAPPKRPVKFSFSL
jgi:hypothetical protein